MGWLVESSHQTHLTFVVLIDIKDNTNFVIQVLSSIIKKIIVTF